MTKKDKIKKIISHLEKVAKENELQISRENDYEAISFYSGYKNAVEDILKLLKGL